MVRRSQRLRILLTLAEREEQDAGRKLEQVRRQLSREQQQLAQLREYHRDYSAHINGRRQGLRGADMITYRQFLQQLSRAEEEQANAVQRWQKQLDGAQRQWWEKHQYRKSMGEWIERLRGAEDIELDKREQRVLDELVLRKRE